MNSSFFNDKYSNYAMTRRRFGRRVLPQIILTSLLGSFLWMTPVQASDSNIDIVDSWVEDGFLFHVSFEAEPANANCEFEGEGLIEFEVAYNAQPSNEIASVFGVAIWYPNAETKDWIATQGQAIGPQAFCTTFSPCRIQEVNIVKAWCPVSNGPLYSW